MQLNFCNKYRISRIKINCMQIMILIRNFFRRQKKVAWPVTKDIVTTIAKCVIKESGCFVTSRVLSRGYASYHKVNKPSHHLLTLGDSLFTM